MNLNMKKEIILITFLHYEMNSYNIGRKKNRNELLDYRIHELTNLIRKFVNSEILKLSYFIVRLNFPSKSFTASL